MTTPREQSRDKAADEAFKSAGGLFESLARSSADVASDIWEPLLREAYEDHIKTIKSRNRYAEDEMFGKAPQWMYDDLAEVEQKLAEL